MATDPISTVASTPDTTAWPIAARPGWSEATSDAVEAVFVEQILVIERDLRAHAATALRAQGEGGEADALARVPSTIARIRRSPKGRDMALLATLANRVALRDLAVRLPPDAVDRDDAPTPLARLVADPDAAVATAAATLLLADNRLFEQGVDLPAHHVEAVAWAVAAALRPGDVEWFATDRALADAVLVLLDRERERADPAVAATALATALASADRDLRALLPDVLTDRRVTLFAALLAQPLGIPFEAMATIVADRQDDRLWLALRASEVPRAVIARIGVLLAAADPARDLEWFADTLDAVMATSVDDARSALQSIMLPTEYRAAIAALGDAA